MKAVVTAYDMLTPFGPGLDACWDAITSGQSAIGKIERFNTSAFMSENAATIMSLRYHDGDSLVLQMLQRLLGVIPAPADSALILATTKGEIDLLERRILGETGIPQDACAPVRLLEKAASLAGVAGPSMVVSAACASGSAAIARGASMICSGRADSVLVIACDAVTEFVFSGFSSLMAMDRRFARPFDRTREGLSLGDAAGYALLMSEQRAESEGREVLGEVAGWGLSDDANHMTGPSRESEGLILAATKALRMAGCDSSAIGMISAHGTGTAYNDAMEMRAFRAVFNEAPRPVYSVKGALGHTMGAAGMLELIIALRALKEGTTPPTVNLSEPDELAAGWVSPKAVGIDRTKMALMTNSGFSGINAALVVAAR